MLTLMRFLRIITGMVVLILPQTVAAQENSDWANLKAYREQNVALLAQGPVAHRVVFMGDSITEFWDKPAKGWFSEKTFVNRGISGQTTPQMLLRFRQDVIDLNPEVVVILAGTNDIAGNTGPATPQMIAGNIASMSELAKAHGIEVIICALLPANRYYWSPEMRPAEDVIALNQSLKLYAEANNIRFVDFYTPMKDANAGLRVEYGEDGVHPNAQGYAVMEALIKPALESALHDSPDARKP